MSHIKLIDLLSACAKNNTFCVLSIRQIINIEQLVKFIISNEIPYLMKPSYLGFFMSVFYVNLNTNCPVSSLSYIKELFVDFIIPELEVFIFYVSYFIECLEKKRKLLLLTY